MNEEQELLPEEESLAENIKKIVGGVATIVAIVVPFILIRKLVRVIEEGDTYQKVARHLS